MLVDASFARVPTDAFSANSTRERLLQLSKQDLGMLLMLAAKVTFSRDVHPQKSALPHSASTALKVRCMSEVLSLKALLPTCFKVAGRVSVKTLELLLNALSPMCSTNFGSVNSMFVQNENALSPIHFTELGNSTDFTSFVYFTADELFSI